MLVKCYALIAVAWCFYTGSATWSLSGTWVPVLALATPAVIFFVGSFILCQFPLHRRMVQCKRTELIELDDVLDPHFQFDV